MTLKCSTYYVCTIPNAQNAAKTPVDKPSATAQAEDSESEESAEDEVISLTYVGVVLSMFSLLMHPPPVA